MTESDQLRISQMSEGCGHWQMRVAMNVQGQGYDQCVVKQDVLSYRGVTDTLSTDSWLVFLLNRVP